MQERPQEDPEERAQSVRPMPQAPREARPGEGVSEALAERPAKPSVRPLPPEPPAREQEAPEQGQQGQDGLKAAATAFEVPGAVPNALADMEPERLEAALSSLSDRDFAQAAPDLMDKAVAEGREGMARAVQAEARRRVALDRKEQPAPRWEDEAARDERMRRMR